MANWTETWKPRQVYRHERSWNTLVSTFETGEEQRRAKQSVSRSVFTVQLESITTAVVDAIAAFFEARQGMYDAFNFPSYNEYVQGTALAFVEGGASKDTITDSGSTFVTKGFDTNHDVWVAYSGSTPSNNGIYTVYSVAAGTITLNADQDIAAESANSSIKVYKSYSVRFASAFNPQFIPRIGLWSLGLSMVEVI